MGRAYFAVAQTAYECGEMGIDECDDEMSGAEGATILAKPLALP